MISASIRHRFLWIRIVCCILVILDFSTESSAFQINIMSEYKPPLKSSVNQLQSGRFGREDRRTLSFFNKRTSKSAFAGTLSMPSSQGGVQTFEGRMRDLVMGDRRTAEPSTAHRHLPSNLQIIESLKDYKRVVADEKEKIVAVRFYASYCKVCEFTTIHGRLN